MNPSCLSDRHEADLPGSLSYDRAGSSTSLVYYSRFPPGHLVASVGSDLLKCKVAAWRWLVNTSHRTELCSASRFSFVAVNIPFSVDAEIYLLTSPKVTECWRMVGLTCM